MSRHINNKNNNLLRCFDMDDLEICSNWTCKGDKLKNVITFIQPEIEMCDIENVTPEKCVCLEKDENDKTNFKPELNLKLKYSVNEIRIFSEGSIIEVFGVQDEYLFTCISEFVDDWEGMAVYRARIVLPNLRTCKLKFTRIKEPGRIWLYSVQLSTVNGDDPCNNLLFNFDNVNSLINNSSQKISEKAEKFKKFFELYMKNSKKQPFNVQTLINIIDKECNSQLSDCKKAVLECFNSSNFLTSGENVTATGDDSGVKKNELLSPECQYLKGYIDKKFTEMKEDLLKCLEVKLCELRVENNSKLDYIIKLLENSKVN